MANQQRNTEKPPPSPYAMLNIGMEMAAPLAVLVLVGYKADEWWGTDPWLKLAGALLGLVLGFYNFYKRLIPSGGKRP